MERKKIAYHILFWLFIYAFVFDYFYDLLPLQDSLLFSAQETLMYIGFAYLNLLVFIPQFYVKNPKNNTWLYLGVLVVFIALCLVLYNVTGLEADLMGEVSVKSKISFTLNSLLFFIISFLYWYYERFRYEQQKALMLQNEKLSTEMELLKAQISPHFLFNSLNNIYSLSLAKSDDAPVMVEKLSDILRYLIYEGKKERVALKDEVDLIQKYLHIYSLKKVRGAENISLKAEGVNDQHQIVPLLLINFVENTFKHGDLQHDRNSYLNIQITVSASNELLFEIENSKQPKEQNNGIGLTNVKQQLKLHYNNQHQLTIDNQLNTFKVVLKLNV